MARRKIPQIPDVVVTGPCRREMLVKVNTPTVESLIRARFVRDSFPLFNIDTGMHEIVVAL